MFYKINKKLYLVVSIFILVASSFPVLVAETYYVATTGSDLSPNDGTILLPWKTFGHAIARTEPGDTILVRAGTYYNLEIWFNGQYGGTPGQVKTLMSYPGEKVILTGNRIFVEANYVRIKGFIINEKPFLATGDHIEILNNHFIILSGTAGIRFYQNRCSHNLIDGNIFDANGQLSALQHAIFFNGGSDNVICNNFISGFCENGIYIHDRYATTFNILIKNNYITKSKFGSGVALITDSRSRIDGVKVQNNVLEENAQFGAFLNGKVRNVKIYNNTFIQASLQSIPYIYGNDRCGIFISEDPENVEVKNNIFYNKDTLGTHINIRDGAMPIAICHNLYWPTAPKLLIIGEDWENIIGEFSDEHSIVGNPLFVDEINDDFNLQTGSPAVNVGIDVGLPYIGPAPDLGAFESSYLTMPITINTIPKGLTVHVDGTSYISPKIFGWEEGSSHTIGVTSPQSQGTDIRHVYDFWSDNGDSIHIIIVHDSVTTYTANFATQYYLTVNSLQSNPQGSSWYNANSTATFSVTSPVIEGDSVRYIFSHWSGDYEGSDNPSSIVMNSPKLVTANWMVQFKLTTSLIPPEGGRLTLNPDLAWYDRGTSVEITAIADSGYRFSHWGGDTTGTDSTISLVINNAKKIIANFDVISKVKNVNNNLPKQFALFQNFPNPFNPSTTISYSLPEKSNVNLTIYNMRSQKIKTLVNDIQKPGIYSVKWLGQDSNGMNVASGLYIYKLETDNFVAIKKTLLLR